MSKGSIAVQARGRRWRPNCGVCQAMKNDKALYKRVMQSSFFVPEATESMPQAFRMSGYDSLNVSYIYKHMKAHQGRDIALAERQVDKLRSAEEAKLAFMEANEGQATMAYDGLEQFIRQGRLKLVSGSMPITANSFLQAIKIKTDIDSKNKDLKLDVLKMMKSASGQPQRAD